MMESETPKIINTSSNANAKTNANANAKTNANAKINYCYLLQNANETKTYIGSTNNFTRRIRQHNGALCGGARYTAGDCWKPAILLSGFPSGHRPCDSNTFGNTVDFAATTVVAEWAAGSKY